MTMASEAGGGERPPGSTVSATSILWNSTKSIFKSVTKKSESAPSEGFAQMRERIQSRHSTPSTVSTIPVTLDTRTISPSELLPRQPFVSPQTASTEIQRYQSLDDSLTPRSNSDQSDLDPFMLFTSTPQKVCDQELYYQKLHWQTKLRGSSIQMLDSLNEEQRKQVDDGVRSYINDPTKTVDQTISQGMNCIVDTYMSSTSLNQSDSLVAAVSATTRFDTASRGL